MLTNPQLPPTARPAAQPASSHSRLVTTKLTANPVVPTATAGWSRPSSVTPSPATATSSPSSTSPLPGTTPIQTSTIVAPLPHVGKVIQPQPRAAVPQPTQHKDSASSKPVWRNVRPPNVAPTRSDVQTSDFPTAAEVANGNLPLFRPIIVLDISLCSELNCTTKAIQSRRCKSYFGHSHQATQI